MEQNDYAPGFRANDQSPIDRLFNLVSAPARAFEGLLVVGKRGGIVLVPLLIAVLFSVASTLLFSSSELGIEQFEMQRAEQIAQLEESGMSAREREEAIEMMDMFFSPENRTLMTAAFSLVGIAIGVLILGIIIFAVARVLEKGSESYIALAHGVSVGAYGMALYSAISLVVIVLSLLFGTMIEPGLGALVPDDQATLNGLAAMVSIPAIWVLIVLGIGTATISRSRTSTATMAIAGTGIVIALVLGGLMVLFSSL